MRLNYCGSTSLTKVAYYPLCCIFICICTFSCFLHMALPSLTVPSIQRPKAGLLLVCGQIRAAFAGFRWEGARRLPALQLWDPIGAEQDGGWEDGIECKKDCKQMKTLRISVERSRDGSADIWMLFLSVASGTFSWGGAKAKERAKNLQSMNLSAVNGLLGRCLTSQGQLLRRGST